MIKEKDILNLIIRFNNKGDVSKIKHPYIVRKITDNIIEIVQRDSIKKGKEYIALWDSNALLKADDHFNKDGFIQLDNKFTIENFDELSNLVVGKISDQAFDKLCRKYDAYHNKHIIDDDKIVHMKKDELLKLNKEIKKTDPEII